MFYKTGLLSRGLFIERGLTFQYLRYSLSNRPIFVCKVSKEALWTGLWYFVLWSTLDSCYWRNLYSSAIRQQIKSLQWNFWLLTDTFKPHSPSVTLFSASFKTFGKVPFFERSLFLTGRKENFLVSPATSDTNKFPIHDKSNILFIHSNLKKNISYFK